MNNSSRILHQVMRNREHGRAVRDRTAQSTAAPPDPSEDGRPHSALSSYDIGIALRISEPNTPKGTIPRQFSASRQSRSRPSSGPNGSSVAPGSASTPHLATSDTRVATAAAVEGHAVHHQRGGGGSTGRPPSPYRRPATADEASLDAKRAIAQLQTRLSAMENQLQQARAQKRLLAVQNRKYRAKLAQLAVDDNIAGAGGGGGYSSDGSRPSSGGAPTRSHDSAHRLLRDELRSPDDLADDNPLSNGTTPSPLPELEAAAMLSNAASLQSGSLMDLTAVVVGDDDGVGGGGSDSASLLELSERLSCASAQQALNTLVDTEKALVEDAMGEAASHKFAFAIEIRSDDDLKELLMEACRKLTAGGGHGGSGFASRSPSQPRSPPINRRSHRSSKGSLKTLLDELKREVSALRASGDKRLGAGVQLCFTLLQQLHMWGDGIASMVERMDKIKSMVLGRAPDDNHAATAEPLRLSNLGAHLDVCLTVAQQLCRHANIALTVADKNHAQLRATVSSSDAVDALQPSVGKRNYAEGGMQHHVGGRDVPSRISPTSPPLLNTPELRITSSIAPNVESVRAMLDALQRRCNRELQRTLRDAATEEDLLKVYQQEIESARVRCRGGGGSRSDACCQTNDAMGGHTNGSGRQGASPFQETITVPTVADGSSASSAVGSPTSRPGSSSRPRSSGAGKPRQQQQAPTPTTCSGVPPVIKHLIHCVNTLHIAFTEVVFGPVECNSRYKALAAQQQDRLNRHRREAQVHQTFGGNGGPDPTHDATRADDSLNGIVLVHRGGTARSRDVSTSGTGVAVQQQRSVGADTSERLLDDVATRQLSERHMQTLANTYGDLLRRDVAHITAYPLQLTAQDEADLAAHIDLAQRLVEMGLLWHDALQGVVRVHHCSDYLALVRHSKPMVSAYFFHNVSVMQTAVSELGEGGAAFADALRDIVGSERRVKPGSAAHHQRKRAQDILQRVKLLSDASHARAKLNWRGLMVLHKHMRMKQLLQQALRYQQQQRVVAGGGNDDAAASDSAADNLRRMVAAFYADQTIKFEAEQRLLRSSLHITLVAVWSELLTLLRDSSDMCLACGLNVEVLDILGPAHADVLVSACRQLAEVCAQRKDGGSCSPTSSISIPHRNLRMSYAHNSDSTKPLDGEGSLPRTQSPCPASVSGVVGGPESTVVQADAWLGLQISTSSVANATRPAGASNTAPASQGKRLYSAAASLKPLRPRGKDTMKTQRRDGVGQQELFFLATQDGAAPRKVYTRYEVLAAENPWLNAST